VGVARTQPLNRAFNNGRRRIDRRITDAEHNHILATIARGGSCVVGIPSIGAVATDPINQRRELHLHSPP
jgi:hypothetical protein